MPNKPAEKQQLYVINEWADAWTSGDRERFLDVFADGVVYNDLPMGLVCHGKNELGAFFDLTHRKIRGFTVTLANGKRLSSRDLGAAEFTMSGVLLEEDPGFPVKRNESFSIRAAMICTFQNGKIHAETDFWDSGSYS